MTNGIDEQAQKFADDLDSAKYIYHTYAILDSLSSSYTMFKYFFDILVPNANSKVWHEYILSGEGIAAIVAETVFLVGFSFLASLYDNQGKEQKKNQAFYQKMIVEAWPYCRDLMKGLKNAYKGWRSTVLMVNLLNPASLNFLIIPLGVTLGILAAANRLMMRELIESRKKMKDNNKEVLARLRNPLALNNVDLVFIRTGIFNEQAADGAQPYNELQIQSQTDEQKYRGFAGEAAGGLIDGLYNYLGVLVLCVFAPQVLVFLVSVCSIYTLISVATRIFQEYEYQHEVEVLKTECELNVVARQIKNIYVKYREIELAAKVQNIPIADLFQKQEDLYNLTNEFEELRRKLLRQTKKTYTLAFLRGLKNGMFAYSALSSTVFLVATILTLSSVACPPIFLMIAIPLGLGFLFSFIVYELVKHYKEERQRQDYIGEEYLYLLDTKLDCMDVKEDWYINDLDLNVAIDEGLEIEIPKKNKVADGLDVARAFSSGFTKGQKFAEFAGSSLQIENGNGQYKDSPWLFGMVAVSSIVFSIVLALRFFARAFHKDADKPDSENTNDGAQNNQQNNVNNDNQVPPAAPGVETDGNLATPPVNQQEGEQGNVVIPIPEPVLMPSPPTVMSTLSARFFLLPPKDPQGNLLPNAVQLALEDDDLGKVQGLV